MRVNNESLKIKLISWSGGVYNKGNEFIKHLRISFV